MSVVRILNFIDGQFVATTCHFDSLNPSTGQPNASIPDSGAFEVDAAVAAARKAFVSWSCTAVSQRASYLFKLADLIDANAEELAFAESQDQGKTLKLAQTLDIPRAAKNFRHFATAVQNDVGMSIAEPDSGIINYVTRSPVGVAGIITPWNLPLYLLTFKLAPALAYGNTVVAKPSELTSVTAYLLAKLIQQSGLPNGVINIVFGKGSLAGEALVRHPDVPLISFTGGTVTGKKIAEATAPMLKKLSLELGGKNPAIVFDDCPLDKHLDAIVRSCFLNQAEICLASSRIFVQRGIYDRFLEEFTKIALNLKIGDPLDPTTFMGPMISKEHQQKVLAYLKIAQQEGSVQTGNLQLPDSNSNGFYCPVSVVSNISDSARCMQEEIFGPVVCIVSFNTEQEAIERANNTSYGLSASVWSSSVDRIHRVAGRLKVGTVWCNCWLVRNLHCPFGGVKQSGIGREGTFDSGEFFTEKKTVCLKLAEDG